MIVKTNISYGYKDLLEIFFQANNLIVFCELRKSYNSNHIDLTYEDNSDTAISLTFMGMKHSGIENMLCDYLLRCGIDKTMISIGRVLANRDMKKLDQEWENRRKELGLR